MSKHSSEGLNINYSVPHGLISMLASLANKPEREIWCYLSDIANVCASRLVSKKHQTHSWTTKKFPETDVELRVDMHKYVAYRSSEIGALSCEIRLGKVKFETFTQEQVNEYITESILLGVNDDNI